MLDALFGSHPLVAVLASVHGGALVLSSPGALLRRRALLRAGTWLLVVALALNTWVIAQRWIEAGRPPFKTLFETLLFYPWCVAVVALALALLQRSSVLVPFASAISLAGLAWALARPDTELVRLPPALQSAWFVPHVVTYFMAYAGLFASCSLAVLALSAPKLARLSPRFAADTESLQRRAHGAAVFGTAALTLGLAMGALWAKYAWGDYWTWDPKENWALVSWLAYVIYLHLRLMQGWHGRPAMWMLVLSFGAVVFTYLGMNLLPGAGQSLHAYQR